MRLVLSRAFAGRTLLVAAGAATLVTTVLLTAFVLYAQLLPTAGVRAAVTEAPLSERTLLVGAPVTEPEQDPAVRELFAGGLAGVPLEVHRAGYATSQRLPADLPGVEAGEGDAYAVVGFFAGIEDHTDLVAGAWPEPVNEDAPAQVALPAPVAEQLELALGDRVEVEQELLNEPAPVEVVGLWEPHDPDDAYWRLAAARLDSGLYGPFVVHQDEFEARYQRLSRLEWVAAPEPAALAEVGPAAARRGYDDLVDRVAALREQGELHEAARISSGLAELASRLEAATVVNRSGLVLPAALLAVISGYGLVLVARLLATHRGSENALLRARGASRRQLVRFATAEAGLVVAPAALLGAPVGAWLVGWVDRSVAARGLGLTTDLAASGWWAPPLGWLVALVAAVGCGLALALPAAGRGRTWVAEQQERSRPRRFARAQRSGVDLALVGLAVLAWWQLRQYGSAVTPSGVGGLGVDPLLVLAPVVGVLAATTLALRLLPVATRLGVRWAGRRDGFASLLGMWQADRRPHAGPVLLLVLAVATAVLAPAVATTWQESQRDQAAHLVGADLRLQGGAEPATVAGELTGVPGVAGVMSVHRGQAALPEGGRSTLLAVDAAAAAQVVHVRPDLAGPSPEDLFAPLVADRPELTGVPLPEGAQRLVGVLRFTAPDPFVHEVRFETADGEVFVNEQEVDPPSSGPAAVHLVHPGGAITSVTLGLPIAGEPMPFDVSLPAGASDLVALGTSARTNLQFDVFSEEEPPPVEVTWRWEDLRVVDAAGVEHPVEVPPQWDVRDSDRTGGPRFSRTEDGVAVTAVLDRRSHVNIRWPFQLAAPVSGQAPIPAVATEDVLAQAGASPGDQLDLGGLPLRMVDTVAAMPGTADGSGVLIDFEWLNSYRLLALRNPPQPNEWWVAVADRPTAAAAAGDRGFTVVDQRAEEVRLLDDPLGTGVLLALWTAAAAAALLAAFGLVVDSRSTAVRRQRELAVLHTVGAAPSTLARALVVEQAALAGLGVVAGVAVGLGVAAAMGTSLVLTPAGQVPVPPPLLTLSPVQLPVPAIGLFLVAVLLGALVARRARRDVAATALRIGED